MDYRAIPEAHRDAFRRVTRYAFEPETGPDLDDAFSGERPDVYERRGLYEVASGAGTDASTSGGETPEPEALRAVCGLYDFTARVRGAHRPLGGVATVASPPETRREGHVARLLDAVHEEFRERGISLAALWPFEYSFYRRFGYATTDAYAVATVPPGKLRSVAGEPRGSFERLGPEEHEALDEVHREWATEGLAIRRTEGWWRHRLFATWDGGRYVYGWFDEGGDLRGYLAYRIEDEGDADGESLAVTGKTMRIAELAAVDETARRQLLRFCRNHDSQVERVRLVGPEWARLLERLSDPTAADVTLRPGPMVRVVDLPTAAETLDFPSGVEGRFTVAVDDDRCPWNDGTFAIEVDGGSATCEPVDARGDIEVSIGGLSLALTGVRGVPELRRAGDLTVRSEAAAETFAAACPPESTWLREHF